MGIVGGITLADTDVPRYSYRDRYPVGKMDCAGFDWIASGVWWGKRGRGWGEKRCSGTVVGNCDVMVGLTWGWMFG
jgi:hypothetical protein